MYVSIHILCVCVAYVLCRCYKLNVCVCVSCKLKPKFDWLKNIITSVDACFILQIFIHSAVLIICPVFSLQMCQVSIGKNGLTVNLLRFHGVSFFMVAKYFEIIDINYIYINRLKFN